MSECVVPDNIHNPPTEGFFGLNPSRLFYSLALTKRWENREAVNSLEPPTPLEFPV